MYKYFDKDFWKFLVGFATIITFSLIFILVAKIYQSRTEVQAEKVTSKNP